MFYTKHVLDIKTFYNDIKWWESGYTEVLISWWKQTEKLKNIYPFYYSVHSSIINNSQEVEIHKISITCWLGLKNVHHPYNGISFSWRNHNFIYDSCYSMDNLKNMLSEKTTHRSIHILWLHLCEIPRIATRG